MSKTYYYKKFNHTGFSFNRPKFSKEEGENTTDLRLSKNNKDSWKIFINLKKIKNSQKIKDIMTPNNLIKNRNLIPIINNLSIIKNNKAPSLQENQKEIVQFIKRKRMKKNNELNNMYNTMLINESKLFRNNLYLTQSEFHKFNSNSSTNKDKIKNPDQKITRNLFNNVQKNEITGSTSFDFFKNNVDNGSVDSNINNETKFLIKSSSSKFPFPSIIRSKSILNSNMKNNDIFYKTTYKIYLKNW